MTILKNIFCCILFIVSALHSLAQQPVSKDIIINGLSSLPGDSAQKLFLKDIIVKGARQTKVYIVLREIPFKKGDTLINSKLHDALQLARQQVYNLTLFNEVQLVANVSDSNAISITVQLKERWYIFPVPQFQLVDRNFNVWAKTYHYSFDRVNYGLKFVHYNLTGRKDPLRIYLLNGYSRNISFSYTAPYSNSSLTEGFTVAGGFTQNREIAYGISRNNMVLFYPVDSTVKAKSDFVRNSWYISGGYIIRKGLFKRHVFSGGYVYLKVADSVISAKYNPNYFKDLVTARGYAEFQYTYQYVNVDNVLYALKGTASYFSVVKRGFGLTGGINMFSLEAGVNKYFAMGKNWFSSVQLNGKIKLPLDQAYINQRGLGYNENYLRGLEYYVIDGVVTGLIRTTLKKKIYSFSIPVPFAFLHRIATHIPFTFYAKTYADLGYSYNKPKYDTYLNNRLLYSGGFGIDILTLYDVNLRFEYSFNQLKESGIFFHSQSGF